MNNSVYPEVIHHGAVSGVTGSCHQLILNRHNSILVDCGLFQGAEASAQGAKENSLEIDFSVSTVRALLVTHCHIDHVGRIPYLLAAGFAGSILCTPATAQLLPLMLEDAIAIGFTHDKHLVGRVIKLIKSRIIALPYGEWRELALNGEKGTVCKVRFKPAGHILGSAYIECDVSHAGNKQRVVFSGDLGGPHTPLLPNPKPPYKADILVIESTYGDKIHHNRKNRQKDLQQLVKQCLQNKGVILVPAFSIGRTQELLYELEDIIYRHKTDQLRPDLNWDELEIIVDSPLANKFTEIYKQLRPYWDEEAKVKLHSGRHPLSFDQLTTINSHAEHLQTIAYLKKTARPCIVLAASGMCNGGRIVNYLQGLIEDERTDILFVGYQARGTTGRIIQQYGPQHGYVVLNDKRYTIKAGVHTLSGYSAHADQQALLRFIKRMRIKPRQIRLVHGDDEAKKIMQQTLSSLYPECEVVIPQA